MRDPNCMSPSPPAIYNVRGPDHSDGTVTRTGSHHPGSTMLGAGLVGLSIVLIGCADQLGDTAALGTRPADPFADTTSAIDAGVFDADVAAHQQALATCATRPAKEHDQGRAFAQALGLITSEMIQNSHSQVVSDIRENVGGPCQGGL